MNKILSRHRFSCTFLPSTTLKTLQNVPIRSNTSLPAERHTIVKKDANLGIAGLPQTANVQKIIDPSPLLQPKLIFNESLEVSKDLLKLDVHLEKSPLSFQDVPSPAIFRFWEKYWKYVPLLGTQLFCSLLINDLTKGNVSWSRNINSMVPVRFLFNEYGPVVRIHGILTHDVVLIHRPEHIAEVLRQENENPIRSGLDTLHHYRTNLRKYKLPGLFSMQGPEWIELRQKIDKPFTEEIYKFTGKIGIASDELVQRICNIRNRQDEVPADFSDDLTRWGMETFAILMFNKKMGFLEPSSYNASAEQLKLTEALLQAHKYMSLCESGFQMWRLFETPFSKRLFSALDIIDGYISKHIRQIENALRNQSSQKLTECSVIEQLLIRQQLQPEDISTLLMDSLMLGVIATVNTQAFLLYSIAKNPRVQDQIYNEIMDIAPDGRTMNKEKLQKMVYLKASLKECLRLYPSFAYITRLLQQPITLHGYSIPKGTYIVMANEISSQREENFEDPEKFKPERWLSGGKLTQQQEYSCLPFGHGIRSCVGKSIAEMEIMILTSALLRKFKLEYDYANIRGKYLTVNVPNKPLRFRFIDREAK